MADTTPQNELSSNEIQPDEALISAEKKNTKTIYCPECKSKILLPNVGQLAQKAIFLHNSRQKKEGEKNEGETIQWFWKIGKMIDFENIGFSRPVGAAATGYRYLTCADCEQNVLGIQFLEGGDTSTMWLSANRVSYE